MLPEHQRQERFTAYAHLLRERFSSGILAELQPLSHEMAIEVICWH